MQLLCFDLWETQSLIQYVIEIAATYHVAIISISPLLVKAYRKAKMAYRLSKALRGLYIKSQRALASNETCNFYSLTHLLTHEVTIYHVSESLPGALRKKNT